MKNIKETISGGGASLISFCLIILLFLGYIFTADEEIIETKELIVPDLEITSVGATAVHEDRMDTVFIYKSISSQIVIRSLRRKLKPITKITITKGIPDTTYIYRK